MLFGMQETSCFTFQVSHQSSNLPDSYIQQVICHLSEELNLEQTRGDVCSLAVSERSRSHRVLYKLIGQATAQAQKVKACRIEQPPWVESRINKLSLVARGQL